MSHEPILWRHVTWEPESPDHHTKQRCRWGWIFYRRVKTRKTFYRPMNRTVHAHMKSLMPDKPDPDSPVSLGGGARPNTRFRTLCDPAEIGPKTNLATGEMTPWVEPAVTQTADSEGDCSTPFVVVNTAAG